VSPAHIVRRADEATWGLPAAFQGHADGVRRWTIVDEAAGAVHTGFGIGEMEPGGRVDWHVHSYEESLYLIDGELVLRTAEAAVRLRSGDYALVPLGQPHALANEGSTVARFAAMSAPQPRPAHGGDTYFVPPLPELDPIPVDVRDPRMRCFGHIDPESMLVTNQTQDRMAVSASARTALLVYSGITLKMMIDTDLGAQLSTMFMVQNDEGGGAGPHDHPFEETYLILEGEVDATFDGERYHLGPGDVGWAGVGCVHSFSNPGPGHVRWLETQAPAPPARHSYRFARDWTYLQDAIAEEAP
jgi:mannose-6-phosphate isomerase-like protein (cupin superfamily)